MLVIEAVPLIVPERPGSTQTHNYLCNMQTQVCMQVLCLTINYNGTHQSAYLHQGCWCHKIVITLRAS